MLWADRLPQNLTGIYNDRPVNGWNESPGKGQSSLIDGPEDYEKRREVVKDKHR